ncbi:hypothetical protein AXF42_Ash021480 [Apostasia shenzhenica]|uniref:Uncharacterized protein n=1 Tax=Apostasia shenzhenica TaxID=1088818 RepID=A0A2H9ZVQ9_9ASPA|nr:hypothetical protein AXF42_Ash021477 [Apostasia shenzhenica]PKA48795.1 hypothetical protein AXF42_Ash021480 [Apostasia shenzhenica]
MFPPLMHFFYSSASFLNCLLTFRLSPDPRRAITSTAKPPPQPEAISPSQFDRPILTFNPLDLESAEQLPDPADGDTSGAGINHPYWKQIGKIVIIHGHRLHSAPHQDGALPLLSRDDGKPLCGVGAEEDHIPHPLLGRHLLLPSHPPHPPDSRRLPSGLQSTRRRSLHLPLPLLGSACDMNCTPR